MFGIGGVSGTPMFYVNGVFVDAPSSWGLEEWKKLLDPLLGVSITISLLNMKA